MKKINTLGLQIYTITQISNPSNSMGYEVTQDRAGAKNGLSEIKPKESELINDITKKWKGKKTKELVEFTHNQLPYLYASENDIISLGLITQENPDECY